MQTFGLFMGLSFLIAAYTLVLEFKRKEKAGLLKPVALEYKKGYPATFSDLFFSGLIGFLIGFKLIEGILNYSDLVINPQEFLLSVRGSWPGGILFAAFLAWLKYRDKEKEKLVEPKIISENVWPHQLVGNITMYAAIAGLAGAKIFHNLENLHEFAEDPVDALISFSGLTYYGGLICAAVAVLWYAKKINVPPLVMCDVAAPGLMLSYGTGRLGCHLSGDGDWGIANNLPKPDFLNLLPDWMWAFNYPHNVVNDGVKIPGCVGMHCYELIPPVFPTPFYEAVICITLFFLLWNIRKKIAVPGILFCIYLMLNGIERFFIEQIRVNTLYHILGHAITQAEIISVLLIITGATGYYLIRNKKSDNPKI